MRPDEGLVMLAGAYGSGKTEVAVNLALQLAAAGRTVQIADLDIVNPYFRCREARQLMERHGIRVVIPPGALAWADLPVIVPEVQGMLDPPAGTVTLFDVGGDDVGARVLSSLRPLVPEGRYQLWQVLNSKRPFGGSVERCLELRRLLEGASRLAVTGLVVNSHLVTETEPRDVLEGWHLGQAVARATGLPVRCVAIMEALAGAPELAGIDAPILRLKRHMLPPWLARDAAAAPLPAPHPTPLGKPEGAPHGSHRR